MERFVKIIEESLFFIFSTRRNPGRRECLGCNRKQIGEGGFAWITTVKKSQLVASGLPSFGKPSHYAERIARKSDEYSGREAHSALSGKCKSINLHEHETPALIELRRIPSPIVALYKKMRISYRPPVYYQLACDLNARYQP